MSILQVVIAVSKSVCNRLFDVIVLLFEASVCWRGKACNQSYWKPVLQESPSSISSVGVGTPCALSFQGSETAALSLAGKKPVFLLVSCWYSISSRKDLGSPLFSVYKLLVLTSCPFPLIVGEFPKQNNNYNHTESVSAFIHPLNQSLQIISMRDLRLARAAWSGMS